MPTAKWHMNACAIEELSEFGSIMGSGFMMHYLRSAAMAVAGSWASLSRSSLFTSAAPAKTPWANLLFIPCQQQHFLFCVAYTSMT